MRVFSLFKVTKVSYITLAAKYSSLLYIPMKQIVFLWINGSTIVYDKYVAIAYLQCCLMKIGILLFDLIY